MEWDWDVMPSGVRGDRGGGEGGVGERREGNRLQLVRLGRGDVKVMHVNGA